MSNSFYQSIIDSAKSNKRLLAILVDPEKFILSNTASYLAQLPSTTTHLFVGGSTSKSIDISSTVLALKQYSSLPIILFPGDSQQLTSFADGLLFLTLLSGRNPKYLIEEQIKAVPQLKEQLLEIISTGYILIDGGRESAVERVTQTQPMSQSDIPFIVNTALAGQYMGAKLIYLEAGSGAELTISQEIISAVKKEIDIPLIVGGGIRTEEQLITAYEAGADMVVMGTAFEE